MKKIYQLFFKTALAASVLYALPAGAQSSGSVDNGNCGVVTQNFNNGTGGYTSPSLYGDRDDSSFFYNGTRGLWTEMDVNRTAPPGTPRFISIISPPYVNPNPAGTIDIGFYYIVPNPNVDRFLVRLFRLTTVSTPAGDETVTDLVATSGYQTFTAFSTPSPYTDPSVPTHNGFQGAVCIRINDVDITAGSNIRYRADITYQIFEPAFTAFDDFSLGDAPEGPLPVNFIGIAASRNGHSMNIRWDVGDEVNVSGYQVERSTSGRDFAAIGSVAAAGKSVYGFTDNNPYAGTVFYRIKSVDVDGSSKYSSIIRVAGSNSFSNSLKVYPIPAKNDLTVQHRQLAAGARIVIATVDGRTVKTVTPATGASHTPVDITALKAGLYILRLNDGRGNIETIKFLKQ
ncbi:MAG TPA: T9SS type A sorting domain-containing protein [Chitinophagaceae bacterium]|nr:T9SS type A sorting domain-containing protein [Chitinophagaceae bacterium]